MEHLRAERRKWTLGSTFERHFGPIADFDVELFEQLRGDAADLAPVVQQIIVCRVRRRNREPVKLWTRVGN